MCVCVRVCVCVCVCVHERGLCVGTAARGNTRMKRCDGARQKAPELHLHIPSHSPTRRDAELL